MGEGWLIDSDDRWIWRFHRDQKGWIHEPKVFIDRGRRLPEGPPGGRTAVAVFAAIGGVAVQTSDAQYRVAIFDVRDGQCIWANFDPMALPDGNWIDADEEAWAEIIDKMYSGFSL